MKDTYHFVRLLVNHDCPKNVILDVLEVFELSTLKPTERPSYASETFQNAVYGLRTWDESSTNEKFLEKTAETFVSIVESY